jgi:hypothetical protein
MSEGFSLNTKLHLLVYTDGGFLLGQYHGEKIINFFRFYEEVVKVKVCL